MQLLVACLFKYVWPFLPPCINGIISKINLGKLVQRKSNDKFKIFGQFGDEWLRLVLCFLLFSFYWRLLSGKSHVFQKNIYKKYHPLKSVLEELLVWKTVRMHTVLWSQSYLSLKYCIISKPFNWFANHINCLVSIPKYFRSDYNIVCVQGIVHRPLVSSSYNHEVKVIFFTRRTGEYQIKYVSRPRTLAEYQPNWKF